MAKYCINSVIVIEELLTEVSTHSAIWTIIVGLLTFFFWSWIKKALKFLKSLVHSGAFSTLKEAFIETRMMQYMFGSTAENPELKRQIWNTFCQWTVSASAPWFWEQCCSLKQMLEMSANAQGLCVHEHQWLLTFSVFVEEVHAEIAKYHRKGWNATDFEHKLQVIAANAAQWIECQSIAGAENIQALREQVLAAPLQKVDHVMELMRAQLVQSQNQQKQSCQLLEDVVAAIQDQTAVLKEGFQLKQTAD